MLSVLFGEQPDVLKQILSFYLPKGAKILDVTYGHGKLYASSGHVSFNDYIIVGNDVDPESPAKYHYSFPEIQKIAEIEGLFDAAIYDPPYKYDTPSYVFNTPREADLDWKPRKTKWTVNLQLEMARELNKSLPMVLKEEGLLICKIMDTRLKGKLIPNHMLLARCFSLFELIDILVYIRTLIGLFKNNRHSQTAHGYYLIFRRKNTEEQSSLIRWSNPKGARLA